VTVAPSRGQLLINQFKPGDKVSVVTDEHFNVATHSEIPDGAVMHYGKVTGILSHHRHQQLLGMWPGDSRHSARGRVVNVPRYALRLRFLQYIVFFCTVFWSPQIGAW
jgi:hypothetical protein